ncbi:DUF1810 domain-containing protein [Pedobacter sp.]|uniref:DUF1810 domain-containing protein n=1 Tax=Pedobacter sp. TaxID=1411316 RepID=UPI003D7F86E0
MKNTDLDRFVKAQNADYDTALSEIINGRKQLHWMWYIFPQIQGLGYSETANYYAIRDLEEARDFLAHPVLGARLIRITTEVLKSQKNVKQIFGSPDDLKFHSCMTLFSAVNGSNPIFEQALKTLFNGQRDNKTIEILMKLKGKH